METTLLTMLQYQTRDKSHSRFVLTGKKSELGKNASEQWIWVVPASFNTKKINTFFKKINIFAV